MRTSERNHAVLLHTAHQTHTTHLSSCAKSKAFRISLTVIGLKALCTSGLLIAILAVMSPYATYSSIRDTTEKQSTVRHAAATLFG